MSHKEYAVNMRANLVDMIYYVTCTGHSNVISHALTYSDVHSTHITCVHTRMRPACMACPIMIQNDVWQCRTISKCGTVFIVPAEPSTLPLQFFYNDHNLPRGAYRMSIRTHVSVFQVKVVYTTYPLIIPYLIDQFTPSPP